MSASPQCASLLVRLVNPGVPGKPLMIDPADRAVGVRKEHRTASKPLSVRFHARRDGAPGLRAFDHDDAHLDPPPSQDLLPPAACPLAIGWTAPLLEGRRLIQPVPARGSITTLLAGP